MNNINLSEEEFKDLQNYIYYNLGGSLVEVELEDQHYEHAFREAKRTYLQKGNATNKHRFVGFELNSGKIEYNFEDVDLNTPIRIIRMRSSIFNDKDPFHHAIVSDLFQTVGVGQNHIFNYEMSMQLIDNINRVMCHDISFRYDRKNNKIILDQTPKYNEKVLLEAYLDPSDSELVEHYWIREWALSVCEITLGRAYSKFSEIKTPTGTTQLPGDDLIQAGKERQEELMRQINEFADQYENPQAGFILKG